MQIMIDHCINCSQFSFNLFFTTFLQTSVTLLTFPPLSAMVSMKMPSLVHYRTVVEWVEQSSTCRSRLRGATRRGNNELPWERSLSTCYHSHAADILLTDKNWCFCWLISEGKLKYRTLLLLSNTWLNSVFYPLLTAWLLYRAEYYGS